MNASDYNLTQAAYGVRDFCNLVGIGTTKFYELVKAGKIRVTKCGKLTLVLAPDGAAFLDSLREGGH